MPRRCVFTGKRTRAGRRYSRRGRPKRLGGVGVKVTSKTRRTFKPNLQKVRALVDGKVVRVYASTRAIRNGLVVKPPKRDYRPAGEEDESPSR
ncbi:MAG: 50S ribosomal protein L28 [Planctomycetales bacterium 4484_123]|nr:MAG: 50S ribosomal protein L28 [Planctomycetales bacterium 4484_123]